MIKANWKLQVALWNIILNASLYGYSIYTTKKILIQVIHTVQSTACLEQIVLRIIEKTFELLNDIHELKNKPSYFRVQDTVLCEAK